MGRRETTILLFGIIALFTISYVKSEVTTSEPGTTTSPKEDAEKEPGMPEDTPVDQIDFRRYRFHEGKRRYYKVGDVYPCNANMRFFAVPGNNRTGECDCDYYQCSRPWLYDSKSDSCFYAWSKGSCSEGEWYTFDPKLAPICQKFPCVGSPDGESNAGDYLFQNPDDGKCYRAGTKGYCKGENEVLFVYPFQPIPVCRTSTVCYALSVPSSLECIQGSKWYQRQINAGKTCT